MAKFFDEMLAHVRSLTGMRIPFLSVSTAFAGMIFAPAVLLLQLTVEDVTGTYDRIVDLVGNRTPSNWRRLDSSRTDRPNRSNWANWIDWPHWPNRPNWANWFARSAG